MAEPKIEQTLASTTKYLQRVTSFMAQASDWCKSRGLSVENDFVMLREERTAEYQAPLLSMAKDGVSLAKLVPAGSKIIGAEGRVDLIGPIARHAFLFYPRKGATSSTQIKVGEKTTSSSPTPMLSRIDGEGWYWIEATVRRAKRVDESLFIDLLTDVTDYEFR